MNVSMNQGSGLRSTSRLEPPFCSSNTFCSGDSPKRTYFSYFMRLQNWLRKAPAQISDMLDFVSSLTWYCDFFPQVDTIAIKHQESTKNRLKAG